MIKKLLKLCIFSAAVVFPATAAAAEPAPEYGLSRIPWAIKCCGAMPVGMTVGLLLLAAVAVTAAIYVSLRGKGGKRE